MLFYQCNVVETLCSPQPGEKEAKGVGVAPPSDHLLIHCHGGGFVTQSTKAQEVSLSLLLHLQEPSHQKIFNNFKASIHM